MLKPYHPHQLCNGLATDADELETQRIKYQAVLIVTVRCRVVFQLGGGAILISWCAFKNLR